MNVLIFLFSCCQIFIQQDRIASGVPTELLKKQKLSFIDNDLGQQIHEKISCRAEQNVLERMKKYGWHAAGCLTFFFSALIYLRYSGKLKDSNHQRQDNGDGVICQEHDNGIYPVDESNDTLIQEEERYIEDLLKKIKNYFMMYFQRQPVDLLPKLEAIGDQLENERREHIQFDRYIEIINRLVMKAPHWNNQLVARFFYAWKSFTEKVSDDERFPSFHQPDKPLEWHEFVSQEKVTFLQTALKTDEITKRPKSSDKIAIPIFILKDWGRVMGKEVGKYLEFRQKSNEDERILKFMCLEASQKAARLLNIQGDSNPIARLSEHLKQGLEPLDLAEKENAPALKELAIRSAACWMQEKVHAERLGMISFVARNPDREILVNEIGSKFIKPFFAKKKESCKHHKKLTESNFRDLLFREAELTVSLWKCIEIRKKILVHGVKHDDPEVTTEWEKARNKFEASCALRTAQWLKTIENLEYDIQTLETDTKVHDEKIYAEHKLIFESVKNFEECAKAVVDYFSNSEARNMLALQYQGGNVELHNTMQDLFLGLRGLVDRNRAKISALYQMPSYSRFMNVDAGISIEELNGKLVLLGASVWELFRVFEIAEPALGSPDSGTEDN